MEDIPEIRDVELRNAINKLQKRKALGPDGIPNEALIKTDYHTRHFIKEALNKANSSDNMPVTWEEGEVLRLYKRKGQKGKFANEFGITIFSNMGKLYEQIINERVKQRVRITNAQVGGRSGSATTDHILLMQEAPRRQQKRKEKKKKTHT